MSKNEKVRLIIKLTPFIFFSLFIVILLSPDRVKPENEVKAAPAVQNIEKESFVTEPVTEDPFKNAYDVPMPDELIEYTVDTANHYGIDPALVFAIMEVESGFDFLAKSENCYGVMQIHSINYELLSSRLQITNLLDARQNITAGCYILSGFINKYPLERAIVCYNCGEYGTSAMSTAYSQKVLKAMENYK